MKHLFAKYGRMVSFDLTLNILKESPVDFNQKGEMIQKNSYLIGFFADLNNLGNTIIFAVRFGSQVPSLIIIRKI